ncbi:unnamed protein product [Mytilus coruscus]|uniref:Uncharacterized protein n=1 Tax=Mytilus coruscus TaxID=42192 RepID=A0A6J8ERZ2_MYTCO|nr:unnamed protein product [Mytilus coruscus]
MHIPLEVVPYHWTLCLVRYGKESDIIKHGQHFRPHQLQNLEKVVVEEQVEEVVVCQDTAEADSEPQQESVVTPLASPVRRIVEREQALEVESGIQQSDEVVFEQQTATTHPSKEWNMVPTPAAKTKSSSSSSSSSSECSHKLLLDKLTVQFSNFSDKVSKMENMQQEISRLNESSNWTQISCSWS